MMAYLGIAAAINRPVYKGSSFHRFGAALLSGAGWRSEILAHRAASSAADACCRR